MHDAHVHLDAQLKAVLKDDFYCLCNAQSPQEFSQLEAQRQRFSNRYISYGIHPWESRMPDIDDLRCYQEADAIGEIGMDNVWCNVDLAKQEACFKAQLELASKMHKPVVLHTKGCEAVIAQIIAAYSNQYIVHWYSCSDHLQEYLDLDCYFTIGPGIGSDPVIADIARKIPLERLLLESDGLEGIRWARDMQLNAEHYHSQLDLSLRELADILRMDIEELEHQLDENYQRIWKKDGL